MSQSIRYGVAYPRAATFPPVFLMHPANIHFVRGERSHPAFRFGWGMVWEVAGWVLMGTAMYFYAVNPTVESSTRRGRGMQAFAQLFAAQPEVLLLITGGILLIYLIRFVWELDLRGRLGREGQIYLAEITGVDSTSYGRPGRMFYVTITYQFRLPNGTWMRGQDTRRRDDLTPKTLPSRLENAAVLYLSESEKMLL